MKKNCSIILVLLAACVMSLVAEPAKKAKVNYGKSGGYYDRETKTYSLETPEEMTPENSVLLYAGSIWSNVSLVYGQINPDKPAMLFTVKSQGKLVAFPPVKPGSYLKVLQGNLIQARVNINYTGPLNLSYEHEDLLVPSKPGLYYIGVPYEGGCDMSSFEKVKEIGFTIGLPKTEEEYNALMDKVELKALKALIKQYKNTAWEPVIAARMEELEK